MKPHSAKTSKDTTITMLSKYDESSRNVIKIETVVGRLVEELYVTAEDDIAGKIDLLGSKAREVNNQKVTVKIKNHELLSGEKLIGAIIRSSDNDGTYIIGCRMFEDSEVNEEYVNKVMM